MRRKRVLLNRNAFFFAVAHHDFGFGTHTPAAGRRLRARGGRSIIRRYNSTPIRTGDTHSPLTITRTPAGPDRVGRLVCDDRPARSRPALRGPERPVLCLRPCTPVERPAPSSPLAVLAPGPAPGPGPRARGTVAVGGRRGALTDVHSDRTNQERQDLGQRAYFSAQPQRSGEVRGLYSYSRRSANHPQPQLLTPTWLTRETTKPSRKCEVRVCDMRVI